MRIDLIGLYKRKSPEYGENKKTLGCNKPLPAKTQISLVLWLDENVDYGRIQLGGAFVSGAADISCILTDNDSSENFNENTGE